MLPFKSTPKSLSQSSSLFVRILPSAVCSNIKFVSTVSTTGVRMCICGDAVVVLLVVLMLLVVYWLLTTVEATNDDPGLLLMRII